MYKRTKTDGYYNKSKHKEKIQHTEDIHIKIRYHQCTFREFPSNDNTKNESLNNSIARVCPKTKHLSSTNTLLTRVSMIVCINNMGFSRYNLQILSDIGANTDPFLIKCFERVDKKKMRDKVRHTKPDIKRKRKFRREAKTK